MQISRYSLRYLNQALNKPALNSNLALTLGYLNPALTRPDGHISNLGQLYPQQLDS